MHNDHELNESIGQITALVWHATWFSIETVEDFEHACNIANGG